MATISQREIEDISLRTYASWRRIVLSTALAMLLAFVSGTLAGAHMYWWAFSAVMGMCAGIAFLFAFLSLVVTMYFDYEARHRWDTSLFVRTQLPLDRFVARDVLK